MTSPMTRLAGVVGSLGATALLAALSRAPMSAYPDPAAIVRLAWSVRPERIEVCRTLSDAELAEVPAHMRQRVQCEGRSATYRLTVALDGVPRIDSLLTGGGARGDRAVYLFLEVPVSLGTHDLSVRLEREPLPGGSDSTEDAREEAADTLLGARAAREQEERRRRQGEAVPPVLELAGPITANAREVLLVTYDVDRRALVLRTASGAP